jgi:hypothetical protein
MEIVMAKNFETLEVGKSYKNGAGLIVKIIKFEIEYNGDEWPYCGDDLSFYRKDGLYDNENPSSRDLVELIEDNLVSNETLFLIEQNNTLVLVKDLPIGKSIKVFQVNATPRDLDTAFNVYQAINFTWITR